ncbi:RIC2 [Symbiodinium sp. KB8]|nr:RIC2 [Symbiodinium sp. KB8]
MAGREEAAWALVSALGLAFAGEVGVGKTSLLHRLLAGGVARVQLFDTAGQEQYRESISKVYLRGRDVYTLVYDVGRLDTAADLERHWLPLLASLVKPGCAVLLLGNKLDALSDAEQESPALCSAQQSLVQTAKALLPHCSVAHSHVSALTGAGMDAVTSQLEAISTELLCRQEAAAEETVVEPEPVRLSGARSGGAGAAGAAEGSCFGSTGWWG